MADAAGIKRIAMGAFVVALVVSFGILVVLQLGSGSDDGAIEGDQGTVRGLIVEVTSAELRLREAGSGKELVFVNGDDSVSADHLAEHLRDELPIVVSWSEDASGHRIATRIADG